jgi:hypothetical protein
LAADFLIPELSTITPIITDSPVSELEVNDPNLIFFNPLQYVRKRSIENFGELKMIGIIFLKDIILV